jgi:hypothetical protein
MLSTNHTRIKAGTSCVITKNGWFASTPSLRERGKAVLAHARSENEHLGEEDDHLIVDVRNNNGDVSGSDTPHSTFTFDCAL